MRLTPEEIFSIGACAAKVFGPACTVRLFGSRVDDARRGGDIDLHVVAEAAALATVRNEIAFVLALEDAIGEQRIDVIARRNEADARSPDLLSGLDGLIAYVTLEFGFELGLPRIRGRA